MVKRLPFEEKNPSEPLKQEKAESALIKLLPTATTPYFLEQVDTAAYALI